MLRMLPSLLRMLLIINCNSILQAQTHPAEPSVNLGETTFLDAQGGPGFLVEEIFDGDHSGNIGDASGQRVLGSGTVDSVSGVTHFAWESKARLFGGWYGVEVLAVVAHVNAGAMGVVSGSGDLTVSPFTLQWKELKIGPIRLSQRADLDLDIPVGQYDRSNTVNLSSHSVGIEPYYAFTVLASKHLETSWRIHYLWNGSNNATPLLSGTTSTQAGQAIHFNATTGYALPHGLWVGANGYYLKQISDPKINGAPLQHSPEQVGAIGPGVLWDRGHYLFYANAYHEVGVENRSIGNKLILRMEWLPNRAHGSRSN